jgi:WD40 repeat protein
MQRLLLSLVLFCAPDTLPARDPVQALRLEQKGLVRCLTFSPDGTLIAFGVSPTGLAPSCEPATILIDPGTGREKRRFAPPTRDTSPSRISFSPDGSRLAVGHHFSRIVLYSVCGGGPAIVLDSPSHAGEPFAFSQDGQYLASTHGVAGERAGKLVDSFGVWDVRTGKRLRPAGVRSFGLVRGFAFSSDSKTLVAEHHLPLRREGIGPGARLTWKSSTQVWEVATARWVGQAGTDSVWSDWAVKLPVPGQRIRELGAPGLNYPAPSSIRGASLENALGGGHRIRQLSDGTLLLLPRYREQKVLLLTHRTEGILLVQASSGKLLARFTDFSGGLLAAVALSPDGARLAAAGERPGKTTSTVSIWDISKCVVIPNPPRAPLTTRELGQCWLGLAGDSGERAHRAMRALVARPRQAVQLCEQRLGPPLTKRGQEVRVVRAIDVLERLGTKEAVQVLERATKSSCGLVARYSREALTRLRSVGRKAT